MDRGRIETGVGGVKEGVGNPVKSPPNPPAPNHRNDAFRPEIGDKPLFPHGEP